MRRVIRKLRSGRSGSGLPTAVFQGSHGTALFVGPEPRGPSIAAFFAGDDVELGRSGSTEPDGAGRRLVEVAEDGGLGVLRLRREEPAFGDVIRHAIAVPAMIDIHVELPNDVEMLRDQLRTSTTKEDFRRIRKAGFTYRISRDPDEVREFHSRHYTPLVGQQFPEDGRVGSIDKMLSDLDRGGEMVCADIDGEWVAAIFNIDHGDTYGLMHLGIRDADHSIRQKRAAAALIVRSLERGVEVGRGRATLGRSLPFLGKGPVWFKAKWSGVLSYDRSAYPMHFFLDLRHPATRRMLAASPVIHSDNGELVVSAWLDADDDSLRVLAREAGRYPGTARWYVLGEPDTLAAAAEVLSANDRIVPVAVDVERSSPLWLAEVLAGAAR